MKKKKISLKLRTLLIIPIVISLLSWWAVDFHKQNPLLCKFLLHAQKISDMEKPNSLSGGHDAALIEFETYELEFIIIWDSKLNSGTSGIRADAHYRWPTSVWIWLKDIFGIDLGPVK